MKYQGFYTFQRWVYGWQDSKWTYFYFLEASSFHPLWNMNCDESSKIYECLPSNTTKSNGCQECCNSVFYILIFHLFVVVVCWCVRSRMQIMLCVKFWCCVQQLNIKAWKRLKVQYVTYVCFPKSKSKFSWLTISTDSWKLLATLHEVGSPPPPPPFWKKSDFFFTTCWISWLVYSNWLPT